MIQSISIPINLIFCALVMTFSGHVLAEDLDDDSSKALDQTVELLNDRSQFNKAAEESAEGKQARDHALGVAGSEENLDQINNLAGKVFRDLAKEANGDPEKMQKLLEKAMADPQGFAAKFSLEQRRQLLEISKDIEQVKGSGMRH